MTTTIVTRRIEAPPAAVYRALVDAQAVQRWMVPDGMTSVVHDFEGLEGGRFRISLTYDDPAGPGKTSAQTDTFSGRFQRLVPGVEVVQVVEFDSADPSMAGEMTITYRLEPVDGGTELTGTHENLPPGVSADDNQLGWSISLGKLADLVEGEAGVDT